MWSALVSGHAVDEVEGSVVVLERDQWPGYKSGELLGDGLGPGLDQRELLGNAVDGCHAGGHVVQVGLVEHVGVVVETEEVTGVGILLESEECVPVSTSSRSVDPLLDCAGRQITLHCVSNYLQTGEGSTHVVVDVGSPAGNNGGSSVTIISNGADERPELVLLVHQDRASVVTNYIFDTVVEPCLDSIAVVHASNRRWDDAVRAELVTGCDTDLLEPCLVP